MLAIFAVLGGSLMLLSAIGLTAQGHARAVSALDDALTVASEQETTALENYIERAASVILITANNPAFADFYQEPGDRQTKVERGGPTLERVNQALIYLNTLYPNSIGEACFIDRLGPENARAVRGVRAPVADLSPDESFNPFFAPTFELSVGEVHHAEPYVSPDTGEWVIANATLIPMPDGSKPAIVHYEVTIESFRRAAASANPGVGIQVVDSATGYVVMDSRFPQAVGGPLGRPNDHRYDAVVQSWGTSGIVEAAGRRSAYHHLPHREGNANDWYLVASADAVPGLLGMVEPSAVAISALAALLLLAGVLALRSSIRGERNEMNRLQRDIEERALVEEALRQVLEREHRAAESLRTLDEMKNGFLQAVSHELRTPLTSILGYSLTLRRAEEGTVPLAPAERIDMLDRLATNSRKLERMLSDLLDLDRLGRGVLEPELEPTDIGGLARRVVDECEPRGHDIHVTTEPAVVSADAPKIERIIENLVRNAIRHTPEGTTIWVSVRALASGALIKVEDDGDGVPNELREALFEPFRQGPSAARHAQGTGIGLSLVTRFAQLHGGRAWIEDSPQGGASFQVFIPESMGSVDSSENDEPRSLGSLTGSQATH